jgi:hypothetical protein
MMCYKDTTFCVSPNCTCSRKLTKKIIEEANEWWEKGGGEKGEAPIAVGYFCGVPESNVSLLDRYKQIMEGE